MLASRRVSRLQARRQEASNARAAIATRAAGYIRVSTDEQAQHGHGLESQRRAVQAFAESQGYELVTIAEDPGISGATRPSDRPGFAQLINLASRGEFSVLLVWKFDRLARQIVFAVTAVSELAEQHAVAIRSVTEPIDTSTPMGRTIFAVLAGMAEQEREAITERTWHGRREKATKGGYSCGGIPFGYRVDGEQKLVVDEDEAAIVRRIFMQRERKRTYQQIADLLNAAGIKTRRGKIWRAGAVAYIIDNPIYRGDVEYFFRRFGAGELVRAPGAHEAIVTESEN